MKRRLLLFCVWSIALMLIGGCVSSQGLTPATGSTAQPPLIPHEVDAAAGGKDCLECHRGGAGGAPKYPVWHATLVDCSQCHVPQDATVKPFAPGY